MSNRRTSADELVTVADRIRSMQVCRLLMLIALPVLALATDAPSAVVHRLAVLLWVAALATASLAAVNERELRRRRYVEQALRELALALGALELPAEVATTLARFALSELAARRAAVVIRADREYAEQLGAGGLVAAVEADGRRRVAQLPAGSRLPAMVADEVLLVHAPDVAEAWLLEVLPGAANLIVIPFAAAQTGGALVIECAQRLPRRLTRRIERRLLATARQATAQSAAAGRPARRHGGPLRRRRARRALRRYRRPGPQRRRTPSPGGGRGRDPGAGDGQSRRRLLPGRGEYGHRTDRRRRPPPVRGQAHRPQPRGHLRGRGARDARDQRVTGGARRQRASISA